MGQVIDNIVINAKQAMPIGGNIYLKMQNVSIKRDQTSVFSYPANFVKISIKDHGIGMSREILSRIFDPFFSTKETGHGLGLATVFSIVQRHDGWVDVESEPGKGSVFHIFIPASKKKLSIATSPQQIEHRGSGTILVMDDEVFMLDIIDEVLKIMGYTVIRARNGDEVIRLFTEAEKTSKPFLACILDLTIPGGMGGKETAIEIRKIKKDAILIAASGYSEHPIMSKPTDHGFSDRIIKPFRQNELSELMKNISTKHNLSLPV
jgi:CheY-like chemotaxis protein/anti-sigma regulatory factor (Ser/Thr protein kinase)